MSIASIILILLYETSAKRNNDNSKPMKDNTDEGEETLKSIKKFEFGRYAVVDECNMDIFDPKAPNNDYVDFYVDVHECGGYFAEHLSG